MHNAESVSSIRMRCHHKLNAELLFNMKTWKHYIPCVELKHRHDARSTVHKAVWFSLFADWAMTWRRLERHRHPSPLLRYIAMQANKAPQIASLYVGAWASKKIAIDPFCEYFLGLCWKWYTFQIISNDMSNYMSIHFQYIFISFHMISWF